MLALSVRDVLEKISSHLCIRLDENPKLTVPILLLSLLSYFSQHTKLKRNVDDLRLVLSGAVISIKNYTIKLFQYSI